MMIKAALAIILALLAALGAQTWRLHAAQIDVAKGAAALAALQRDHAQAQSDAEAAARKAEHDIAAAHDAAATEYERGKHDAETAGARVAADLRAGTVRLRAEWAGCQAGRVSDAAAAAGQLDAAEQRRIASAGRIIRAAAACDAQVSALQAIVRADRGGGA